MASTPIQFRADDDLIDWLVDRTERRMTLDGLGTRARTELVMWRAAQRLELDRLTLSLSEIGLIADACTGVTISDALSSSVGLVAADVIDATRDEPGALGGKWSVDEDALILRLTRLGPTADAALADAVSRWWTAGADHTIEGWASVGVRVTR